MTNESVQYSTETHFKLAKNRGGCRSQRQQQRCLLPKVITLSASQPSSSKKPYFFALSQRIRRCITRVSRLFYATNTIVALSENPFILGWNIWRQARWWLWDCFCLMCHPKAYWKVSLFRTTTGEKFEIRLTESTPADIRPLETIPAKLMPSGANTCRIEYLQNWKPADLNTCRIENLRNRIPAELNTCRIEHLQTWKPSKSNTCRIENLQK